MLARVLARRPLASPISATQARRLLAPVRCNWQLANAGLGRGGARWAGSEREGMRTTHATLVGNWAAGARGGRGQACATFAAQALASRAGGKKALAAVSTMCGAAVGLAVAAPNAGCDGKAAADDDAPKEKDVLLTPPLRKLVRLFLLAATLWFGDDLSHIVINLINLVVLLYYTKPNVDETLGPFLRERRRAVAEKACAKPLSVPGLGSSVELESARRAAADWNPATALYSVVDVRDYNLFVTVKVSQPLVGETLTLLGLFGEWWVLYDDKWQWWRQLPTVQIVQ